ncbi:MAG TPA: hypothetical protein VFR37_15460 [Longimicrobium sp.]|nr:hypothetical protein [Longimicrobium sp.]
MPYFIGRRVLALSAPLLACLLLSACPGEDDNGSGDDPAASDGATLRIQMTGALLAVPSKQAPGRTHLLMPSVANHFARIGFRGDSMAYCAAYDRTRRICYVNMDGWDLDPIGAGMRAAAPARRIPRGVLDLTHGSGAEVRLPAARPRARSEITLLGGTPSDSCALASWRFNPRGLLRPPRTVELINVMQWDIPLAADSLVLTRRRRSTNTPQKLVTLRTNAQDQIELLIMHVSPADMIDVTSMTTARQPGADSATSEATRAAHRPPTIREHFGAFYDLMGVRSDWRRFPADSTRLRRICPITILGLEDARSSGRASLPAEIRGVRTYSCVLASAESS